MMKTKKLTLSYSPSIRALEPNYRRGDPYRVIKVQHTTEVNPGDFLSKERVDEMNLSRHWDVTIVSA